MPPPATHAVSPARRVMQGVLGLLLLALVFQGCSRMRLKASGAPRAALQQLEQCEEARQLLGEDIDAAWWGWSHGYLRVPRNSQAWSAASGSVDWWMPVAGSSGRGVLHFHGEKHQGFWTLDGSLEADGVRVRLRGCEEP